jgi:hypothetical protein
LGDGALPQPLEFLGLVLRIAATKSDMDGREGVVVVPNQQAFAPAQPDASLFHGEALGVNDILCFSALYDLQRPISLLGSGF